MCCLCLYLCSVCIHNSGTNRFASNFDQGIRWLTSSDFINLTFLGEIRISGKAGFPGQCILYVLAWEPSFD